MAGRIKLVEKVRSLILSGFGINCEEEMCAAYKLAGANASIVHIKDIFSQKVSILDYDILNFPGGFSFGDDLGAGRVLANCLKYKRMLDGTLFFKELLTFLDSGKFILGICNGFQALVALGLLPGLSSTYEQQASLVANDCGKFEDRWCYCRVPNNVATSLLKSKLIKHLPVRHGEGKLVVRDPKVKQAIINQGLNAMQYCDRYGHPTDEYPYNPNGSFINCAALTNPTGQVLGMMPHPEAFLSIYNHPNWSYILRQNPNISNEGEGLQFFKRVVHHVHDYIVVSSLNSRTEVELPPGILERDRNVIS